MSWLIPSLPGLPSWSRQTSASSSTPPDSNIDTSAPVTRDEEEEDLDIPPQFPLPDSAQRSQAPIKPASDPSPAFNLLPPSPTKSDNDEPASDLNIAIIADAIPIGNMVPPPSTTKKPDFGIQTGGGLGAKEVKEPVKLAPKSKKKGKVALAPGCSALDWARLCQSGKNLRGGTSMFPVRVTLAELAKHNTKEDAWSVFNGRVYNITPYLPFHPGGEDEMMRVAGRDGTKLFMLTHSWVNMEYMMQECMVGMLVRG